MNPFRHYSPALERALRTALRAHAGQARKTDPGLPYATHLVHVAFLLHAHGFSEDVVIAGLLHDIVEDTEYTPEELGAVFGESVCALVLSVTEDKRLVWEARKAAYLAGIRGGSFDTKAICCADKLHNLSSILDAHDRQGEAVWQVFSRGRDRTLQFYDDAFDSVSAGWTHPIVEAYAAVRSEARRRFPAPD